jgi:hypothetical protein
MLLPLTEQEVLARGLRIEGHTIFGTDGIAIGDYVAESRLARLDVPHCSPRPVTTGSYPVALGGLPASPSAIALLTTRFDHCMNN